MRKATSLDKRKIVREWKRITTDRIMEMFRFPNLSHLSTEERLSVGQILRKQAEIVGEKLARISEFWSNNLDVYNVYKHGLSVIVGTYGFTEGKLLSISLVRRQARVGDTTKTCTYHIPVRPDTIDYFEHVQSDAHDLLRLLIDSFSHLDAVIRNAYLKAPPSQMVVEIKIHGKRRDAMERAFAEKHIYRNCKFDIFQETPRYAFN